MAKTPAAFRQADVTRAIKAAKAAGVDIGGVEIRADRIVVLAAGHAAKPESALDEWMKAHGQS
ncbi:hypothetical protein ABB55_27310 [Prosthecomicrobium hirschii]|uniref:Uncharacterized protein n=1 Tax=Prosthecodimorpha hirschii TaxID=665126 RepID=A0A0P6W8J6_9HYPH|nr:hypothetical protein [Prosthecomicrobium hirschii]KPL55488.1 hypothetical protein ABB55_27310 [Prosthecomicrobium hirschii]